MAFDLTAQLVKLPFEARCKSQDIFAATMGLRAKAMAILVRSSRFSVCCAATAKGRNASWRFSCRDAAESVRFHSHGGCSYSLEVVHRDTRINFHMSNLPTLVAFLLLFLLGALETVALHHGF